jgi:hypothetical protein
MVAQGGYRTTTTYRVGLVDVDVDVDAVPTKKRSKRVSRVVV